MQMNPPILYSPGTPRFEGHTNRTINAGLILAIEKIEKHEYRAESTRTIYGILIHFGNANEVQWLYPSLEDRDTDFTCMMETFG